MPPLYVLQLQQRRRRWRLILHGPEAFIGGILGALGAMLVIWWLG